MNRNDRRSGKTPKQFENKIKVFKRNHAELEEVFTSSKVKRNPAKFDTSVMNRSCFASPNQKDFGQSIESDSSPEQYKMKPYEKYDIEPIIPDTIAQLKKLKEVLCSGIDKVENSSQYVTSGNLTLEPAYVENSDGSQWQNVDNVDDLEQIILTHNKLTQKGSIPVNRPSTPKNVKISDVPRVKMIAKKFSRCKKNNIEVRKLDEKVVCLEYDVFDESDPLKRIQVMRAFFCIKPILSQSMDEENATRLIPSEIKRNFKISVDNLLNEKEVEIIDGNIAENKPYLEDFKKILTRKTHLKSQNALDLKSLYEMAKLEPTNFSDRNVLTEQELKEVKDLILAKCTSSIYGVCRRTIKGKHDYIGEYEKAGNIGGISQSILAELLRQGAKTNVFE